MYLVFLSSPSRGGKKGGVALGKFWKLFGNLAVLVLAMAEALRMANGFFPVMELPWPLLLTMLVVPLVLVELDIPLLEGLLLFVLAWFCWLPPLLEEEEGFDWEIEVEEGFPADVRLMTSGRNCSML